MKGKLNARTVIPKIAKIIREPLVFVFIYLFQYNGFIDGLKTVIL
jgi:hypothetical protein